MMNSPLNSIYSPLRQFLAQVFSDGLHPKQRLSIFNALLGIMLSQSLRPSAIGRGLASARGVSQKHAIKQVDRLISNEKIKVEQSQAALVKLLVARHSRLLLALDWTCFAKDNHIVLMLRHVTQHGRALPLLWLTVSTEGLKGRKVDYENQLLTQLRQLIPPSVNVVLLADREFGSIERFERLKSQYQFDYVIRFRVNTTIENTQGKAKKARDWLSGKRRCLTFLNGKLTLQKYRIEKIVVCQDKGMKQLWCLACSDKSCATKTIKRYYAKRWGCESSFRDEKDNLFGLGLSKTHIRSRHRRDRLLLLSALAMIFLTCLGKACEALGYDKYLRANTLTKRRTHALFTMGIYLIRWMGAQKDTIRTPLLQKLEKLIAQLHDLKHTFSFI